jgi:hypothetical protein
MLVLLCSRVATEALLNRCHPSNDVTEVFSTARDSKGSGVCVWELSFPSCLKPDMSSARESGEFSMISGCMISFKHKHYRKIAAEVKNVCKSQEATSHPKHLDAVFSATSQPCDLRWVSHSLCQPRFPP